MFTVWPNVFPSTGRSFRNDTLRSISIPKCSRRLLPWGPRPQRAGSNKDRLVGRHIFQVKLHLSPSQRQKNLWPADHQQACTYNTVWKTIPEIKTKWSQMFFFLFCSALTGLVILRIQTNSMTSCTLEAAMMLMSCAQIDKPPTSSLLAVLP